MDLKSTTGSAWEPTPWRAVQGAASRLRKNLTFDVRAAGEFDYDARNAE
jgi:hypothetical protein